MIGQFIQLVPRTLAVFVGGFSLLNVLIGFWNPGFDANIWWIDTRALGAQLASFLLLAYGAVLLFFGFDIEITGPAFRLPGLQIWNAIRRWRNRYRRVAYLLLLLLSGLVLAIIGLNVITFYKLLHFRIQSRFGLPFSLWIALMAATIAISILRQKPWAQNPGPARLIRYRGTRICLPVPSRAWSRIGLLYGLQLIAIGSLFALGQMFCFGYTDYRRPAAVALTFGARVYENGRMSAALYDRTHTAVSLYKTGLVQHLLFSGGPVGNGMHEVEVMRDYAVRQGVPPARIFLDYNGLNTRSSVEYTCDLLVKRNWSSVLAVSTFYHLPRIKLSFQRAGCTAYTVPAVESRILLKLPLYLLREIPAFWSYYALAVESEKLPVAAPRSQ